MVIPEVNKDMVSELEAMGFPTARATRALHFSGKSVAHVFLKRYNGHASITGTRIAHGPVEHAFCIEW